MAVVIAGLAVAEPAWAAALGLGETAMAFGMVVALATYLGFLAALGSLRSTGPNRFDRPVAA